MFLMALFSKIESQERERDRSLFEKQILYLTLIVFCPFTIYELIQIYQVHSVQSSFRFSFLTIIEINFIEIADDNIWKSSCLY